jgi:hypothetical protein
MKHLGLDTERLGDVRHRRSMVAAARRDQSRVRQLTCALALGEHAVRGAVAA